MGWDEECGCESFFEDDLQTFSDNEALEDARADMREMDSEQTLRATVTISQAELEEANRLLALGRAVEDTKECATLMVFSARFSDGCEADIKICNGDVGPWIDAVLFDEDGAEIGLIEPSFDEILGEYSFQGYSVQVEVAA